MLTPGICITGVGHAVPERRVSSREIESDLNLPTGWIERRTGTRERRVLADDRAMSDLAVEAGRVAIDVARVEAADIPLLVLATSTPDHLLPPSAPLVAHRLKLGGGGVDVMGACTGFICALALAGSQVALSRRPALVIAANVLSRRVRPEDAATAALFADAAGAVVISPDNAGEEGRVRRAEGSAGRAGSSDPPGIFGAYFGSDGSKYDQIHIPAGGSREPMTVEAIEESRHLMEMDHGPAFFRSAVEAMARTGKEALTDAGLTAADVDWWIPHQANARLTRRAGIELGIPAERTIDIIANYGNSSAATIPLALSLAVQDGRVRRGDTLLLTAVGAGMLEAGLVLEW